MHANSWDTPDCMMTGDGIEMSARHRSTPDISARVHPAAVVASNMAAPGSKERPATMWSMRYDTTGWDSCTENLHTHKPCLLVRPGLHVLRMIHNSRFDTQGRQCVCCMRGATERLQCPLTWATGHCALKVRGMAPALSSLSFVCLNKQTVHWGRHPAPTALPVQQ